MKTTEIKKWILSQFRAMGADWWQLAREWWQLRNINYIMECLDLLGYDNLMDECRDNN